MLRARALPALVTVVLAGCPTPYGGPVAVPRDLGASELADCQSFIPEVWEEGRAPRPALHVAAQCADPGVCTAYVEHAEVVVWGNAPGATTVHVTFEHPTTGERGEARIPLSFAAPSRQDWLHPKVRDPTGCRREHTRPAAGRAMPEAR